MYREAHRFIVPLHFTCPRHRFVRSSPPTIYKKPPSQSQARHFGHRMTMVPLCDLCRGWRSVCQGAFIFSNIRYSIYISLVTATSHYYIMVDILEFDVEHRAMDAPHSGVMTDNILSNSPRKYTGVVSPSQVFRKRNIKKPV